jgi:hypothetical protein
MGQPSKFVVMRRTGPATLVAGPVLVGWSGATTRRASMATAILDAVWLRRGWERTSPKNNTRVDVPRRAQRAEQESSRPRSEVAGVGSSRIAGGDRHRSRTAISISVAGRCILYTRGAINRSIAPILSPTIPLFEGTCDTDGDGDVDFVSRRRSAEPQPGDGSCVTIFPGFGLAAIPAGNRVDGESSDLGWRLSDGDGQDDLLVYVSANGSADNRLLRGLGGNVNADGGDPTPGSAGPVLLQLPSHLYENIGPRQRSDVDQDGDLDVVTNDPISACSAKVWINDGQRARSRASMNCDSAFRKRRRALCDPRRRRSARFDRRGLNDPMGSALAARARSRNVRLTSNMRSGTVRSAQDRSHRGRRRGRRPGWRRRR